MRTLRVDSIAVASILCAIAPLLVFGLTYGHDIPSGIGVPAILGPFFAVILGRVARARARRVEAEAGLATVGRVLGYLGLAVLVAMAIWIMLIALSLSGWGHP